MTVGDFLDCVEGYNERLNEQFEMADRLNHVLGGYVKAAIASSFSKSAKYPKKPASYKQKKKLTHNLSDPAVAKALYGKKD